MSDCKITKIKKLFFIGLLVFLNLQSFSQALGQTNNAITTAVSFLLIGPDSRTGAMGEVGVALPNDMNAQHWNPAKYVFSSKEGGFSVSYSPWLAGLGLNDIYLAYLSGYYKITKMDAISFSLKYFSMGAMELADYTGANPLGDGVSVNPHEFSLDAAYSRKLTDNLSMSVTGRFIYSNLIVEYSSTSTNTEGLKPGISGAADLGLFYQKELESKRLYNSIIGFGVHISNIGAKMSYSEDLDRNFLPANFRIGTAYTMYIDKYNSLTFELDLNKLLVPTPPVYETDSSGIIVRDVEGNAIIAEGRDPDKTSVVEAIITSWYDAPGGFVEEMKEFIINVGMEYAYDDLLFIRAGYFNEAKTKGARKYCTIGVGIKYKVFSLDAAYLIPVSTVQNPLEHTLRFSLSFDFDAIKASNKVVN